MFFTTTAGTQYQTYASTFKFRLSGASSEAFYGHAFILWQSGAQFVKSGKNCICNGNGKAVFFFVIRIIAVSFRTLELFCGTKEAIQSLCFRRNAWSPTQGLTENNDDLPKAGAYSA